jgi:hypothetical protein
MISAVVLFVQSFILSHETFVKGFEVLKRWQGGHGLNSEECLAEH